MTLSPSLVAPATAVTFANGSDICAFFERATRQHFIDWFNSTCAQKQNWAGKRLGPGAAVKANFQQIWDCIPLTFEQPSINLLQFSALMSILITEVGADLLPVTELCGREQYPGLAYAFCEIPGIKQSYNQREQNRLAGDLFFADDDFWSAHGTSAGSGLVRAAPQMREMWNGCLYPQNVFPTSLDPNDSGFIQEADFFKFRGRGLIQVTWRSNYKRIVEFVQQYSGNNATLLHYRGEWSGKDPDVVCTISKNADWDALFQNTDSIVPCRAIGLHNQASGNYLALTEDAAALAALSPVGGSLYRMGLRINGSGAYAARFCARVIQLLDTLSYSGRRPA